MTFSIRNLLAIVAVAALSMVAWRSHRDVQREQDRLAILRQQAAIKSVQQNLLPDNPFLHQAIRNTTDEYEVIRKLRIQCDAGMELLREKYGRIEPSGPGIVSIRSLPSIRGDTGKPPVAFSIYVPEERKVWIKHGVRDSRSRWAAPLLIQRSPMFSPNQAPLFRERWTSKSGDDPGEEIRIDVKFDKGGSDARGS